MFLIMEEWGGEEVTPVVSTKWGPDFVARAGARLSLMVTP